MEVDWTLLATSVPTWWLIHKAIKAQGKPAQPLPKPARGKQAAMTAEHKGGRIARFIERIGWAFRWPLYVQVISYLALVGAYVAFVRDISPEVFPRAVFHYHEDPIFQPNKEMRLSVVLLNQHNIIPARDVSWKAQIAILDMPVDVNKEFDAFRLTFTDDAQSDVEAGGNIYSTVRYSMTEQDVQDLNVGAKRFFVFGVAVYRDRNGEHEYQFCRFVQEPSKSDPGMRPPHRLCDSHNKYID